MSRRRLPMSDYAPEGAASVVVLLVPPALALVSFWPSARGHWSGPVLAVPALLFGVAFTHAVYRDGPGSGGWAALVYGLLLLTLALASIVLRARRRGARDEAADDT